MHINERLRRAAAAGSDVELKSLLCKPGCDALSKNFSGMTALMYAAYYGHVACVRLLLPVSNTLAQDDRNVSALMRAADAGYEVCVQLLLPASDASASDIKGMTASARAQKSGHKSVAQFTDAYVLSQSEFCAIKEAVGTEATRGSSGPRV